MHGRLPVRPRFTHVPCYGRSVRVIFNFGRRGWVVLLAAQFVSPSMLIWNLGLAYEAAWCYINQTFFSTGLRFDEGLRSWVWTSLFGQNFGCGGLRKVGFVRLVLDRNYRSLRCTYSHSSFCLVSQFISNVLSTLRSWCSSPSRTYSRINRIRTSSKLKGI